MYVEHTGEFFRVWGEKIGEIFGAGGDKVVKKCLQVGFQRGERCDEKWGENIGEIFRAFLPRKSWVNSTQKIPPTNPPQISPTLGATAKPLHARRGENITPPGGSLPGPRQVCFSS